MVTFFELGSEKNLGEGNKLVKLLDLVKWGQISKHLKGLHKNSIISEGGPTSYDELKMFKSVLLGQWHGLSDAALEEALRVRLDFMVFTGFGVEAGLGRLSPAIRSIDCHAPL